MAFLDRSVISINIPFNKVVMANWKAVTMLSKKIYDMKRYSNGMKGSRDGMYK